MDTKKELLLFYRYWFSSFTNPTDWFIPKARNRDAFLKRRFGGLHEEISHWNENIIDTFLSIHSYNKKLVLAIIILLDQVSRQLYRNSCKAFENDNKALNLSKQFVNKFDVTNPQIIHIHEFEFWGMPFEHSECLHNHSILKKIINERLKKTRTRREISKLNYYLLYLNKHTKIIEYFGYYPKRKQQCNKRLTDKDIEYIRNNKHRPF